MSHLLKDSDYIKAWGLHYVGMVIIGIPISLGMSMLMRILFYSQATAQSVASLASSVVALPISYFLFRALVRYFIVRKLSVPSTQGSEPSATEATH